MRSIFAAGIAVAVVGSVAAQTRIYVGEYKFNDPQLITMNLDGSDAQDLLTPPTSDWLLVGVEALPADGKVYWLHGSTPGVIRRANLDGSSVEIIASGLKNPRGLAIDPVGGKIYWAASPPEGNAGGIIQRKNVDGTGAIEEIYRNDPYDPSFSKIGRPVVDHVNGYVYFGANNVVRRVNLDGPPFASEVVATGGSTITRVQVDVANGHLYWIDSDTISDCLVRVNLDNSGFAVVQDMTPDQFGSSGLSDLLLDRAGAKAYWADEIRSDGTKLVQRCNLDGSGLETIRTTPSGWSPAALSFDSAPDQAQLDCNGNGIRDLDDITSGTSQDCNGNGIPDECEEDACTPPVYLLDQGLDTSTSRLIGPASVGAPPSNTWTVFQPFDVPSGGWEVGTIELNGWTGNYNPGGFTATLLADDGSGTFPDEGQALATSDLLFRFSQTWQSGPLAVNLASGRYWVRLTHNGSYTGNVYIGTSGLNSISRSGTGSLLTGRPPIALRLRPPTGGPASDLDGDGCVGFGDFAILSASWGPGNAGGDINGDGDTDFDDFAQLSSEWGAGCP